MLQESKRFEELITVHMSTSYLITKEKTELFALYIIREDIHILLIVYHAKKVLTPSFNLIISYFVYMT